MEQHISLQESFRNGCAAVVSDLGEDGGGVADTFTGGDDESRSLDELHVLPFRMASD